MQNGFGEKIWALRDEHHFSRRELAEGVCSERQLLRIEQGASEPTYQTLNGLSVKLHTDLHELYYGYVRENNMEQYEEYVRVDDMLHEFKLKDLKTYIDYAVRKYENIKNVADLEHKVWLSEMGYCLLNLKALIFEAMVSMKRKLNY